MALQPTSFVIRAAQLPPDFHGPPSELYAAFVERLRIYSPAGVTSFVIGDVEPSVNSGPWFKSGTQLFVWSDSDGRYVPLDISASVATLFTVSPDEPEAPGPDDATIWLRTFETRVIGWYFWDGEAWRPGGNVPASGPTASRPSNPQALEQFFDTDISCLIHWERGAWRTVSGTPGDIKFVTAGVLTAALAANPGWQYLGETNQACRGRVLSIATKDEGATPVTSYATVSGVTSRAVNEVFGAEEVILSDVQIPQHTHLVGGLSALNSDNNGRFYRVDDADHFIAPEPQPPNWGAVPGDGLSDGTQTGQLPDAGAGTMFVTSKQLDAVTAPAPFTEAADPHSNLQPTIAMWALVKL